VSAPREVLVVRLVKGFGRFWWDFLVGDTPELAIAGAVIVVVVLALRFGPGAGRVIEVLLPVLVIAALTLSVLRARHARRG
jgi:hypothetical protein